MTEKQVVRRQPNALQRIYRETVGELRKVSWPTRREAANLTLIVLVVIIMMVLILGSLDLFLSWLLRLLLNV